MRETDQLLASKFVCPRCKDRGAHVERIAVSGTGMSRFFDIQRHRYAFVSCCNCGYTEIFNLKVLEGSDNLSTFLDVIFGG